MCLSHVHKISICCLCACSGTWCANGDFQCYAMALHVTSLLVRLCEPNRSWTSPTKFISVTPMSLLSSFCQQLLRNHCHTLTVERHASHSMGINTWHRVTSWSPNNGSKVNYSSINCRFIMYGHASFLTVTRLSSSIWSLHPAQDQQWTPPIVPVF